MRISASVAAAYPGHCEPLVACGQVAKGQIVGLLHDFYRLGEFLRFGHVFRNVYGFVLEADHMQPLEERFASARGRLTAQISAFSAWMLVWCPRNRDN